jgi:hypothetical protein
MKIRLHADTDEFNGWWAHPEVGSGDHGPGEDDSEQDKSNGEQTYDSS